jgi:glycosyltransferase involved in cell wall biosynthesis
MKITFVLPPVGLSGGIRVVAIHARELHRRGHAVALVSVPPPAASVKDRLKSLARGRGWNGGGGGGSGGGSGSAKRSPSHLDGTPATHRVLQRFRPVVDADVPDADVVIATWWETAEWVAKLSPAKGAKVNFLQHDETQFASDRDRALATWRLPMHKIAVAKWLVDLAKQRSSRGDADVSLVPNAVDRQQFHAPSRGRQAIPTVGMMISRQHFKGCDVALRACALARQKIANLKLLAFCSLPPSDQLNVPADAQVILQPPQDKIREIYAACDAWLFASRSEGFGLPILEAMACRTPVIGTPAGAAPELLAGGGGVLVPMEDAPAIAAAIRKLCVEMPEAAWREMSDAAHRTATAYTWDDAADLFEAALQHAAERGLAGSTRTQPSSPIGTS